MFVFDNEGELLVNLTDVSNDLTQEQVFEKFNEVIPNDEMDLLCDTPFMLAIASEEEVKGEHDGIPVVERTFDEHVKELRKWATKWLNK